MGLRLGTALALELVRADAIKTDEDPWPVIDAIFRGQQAPSQRAYAADLKQTKPTWLSLHKERRELLKLLSRFNLSPNQAKRWFEPTKREKSLRQPVTDKDIIKNPYVIAELDLGDAGEPPISMGTIDRGMLPDQSIALRAPLPSSTAVETPADRRRIRAALVTVLRNAATNGDSLLSVNELLTRTTNVDASTPVEISSDWIKGNKKFLLGIIDCFDIRTGPKGRTLIASMQLTELKRREENLSRTLTARASRTLTSLKADWKVLLHRAISEVKRAIDLKEPRHVAALSEQALALEVITTRKLTALVGRAGTGKTSVIGALVACRSLAKHGILLLAPTGKARVKLGRAAGATAMTIAQFLYAQKRYDSARQRPLFSGETYGKAKTVVIDEASMITLDYLAAVIGALDLAHVDRIILVGDPNQLPPIGVGRPFADLVGYLQNEAASTDLSRQRVGQALARLSVEVRTKAGKPSDTLRLASWFTSEPQRADADRIFNQLESRTSFNDLEIRLWKTPLALREQLLEAFRRFLGVTGVTDITAFNVALGYDERGWIKYADPDGVENFQILSPVRMHLHGVHEINRWVQKTFRSKELHNAEQPWGVKLGDEDIVVNDKVIQLINQERAAYDQVSRTSSDVYLANGEIGGVAKGRSGFLNVYFAGRPNFGFGYRNSEFARRPPLELAYALTVHKAQGSEFRKVFVILPMTSRLLSR